VHVSLLSLFLFLCLCVSLGCVDGTKGYKNPEIFFALQGARSAEWEWEEVGGRKGEQKNRRIRKESVADCFGPFFAEVFWPFLG